MVFAVKISRLPKRKINLKFRRKNMSLMNIKLLACNIEVRLFGSKFENKKNV